MPPGRVDLARFYRKRRRDLLRACRSRAAAFNLDPEEILQQTMVRAQEHLDEFESEEGLLAWCVVVEWNLIRDMAGSAHRHREELQASPGEELHANPGRADRNAHLAADIEEQAADRDELARVLKDLLPRHKKVLGLAYLGHTEAEIAAILNTTPEAATQLLYRARKAAQKGLGLVVALMVLIGAGLRRALRSAASTQPAFVITVVSLSMVTTSVFPLPGRISTVPPAARAAVVSQSAPVPVAKPAHATPAAKTTSAKRTAAIGPAQRKGGRIGSTAVSVPKAKACIPQGCVGAGECPNRSQTGDRLYLKPGGDPCAYYYTENTTPVCQYVPSDNPAVGCHQDGDPQWTVNPPPPSPSPERTPL